MTMRNISLTEDLKGGWWHDFYAWLKGAVLWLHMERAGVQFTSGAAETKCCELRH